MSHRSHPRRPKPAPSTLAVSGDREASSATADAERIVQRPDGYYWQAPDGHTEFGPFLTLEQAQAGRDSMGDEPPEGGEVLRQAERDIGINEWLDAETGEPAEGQSPPHLEAE